MQDIFTKTNILKLTSPFQLESGVLLDNVEIAYETYGELNERKSNAILICHAFTGDSHVSGFKEGEKKPGWWDKLVGPNKGIDTNKFFIVCSNVLGGCQGTTGPKSINKKNSKPYAMTFPFITIKDMVSLQKELVMSFGIESLVSVVGGSMGGMQVLEWVNSYPSMLKSAIPISTTMKHSPQQIAFNEVSRRAIMLDPFWNNGNYYDKNNPELGLSIARMIGHITYMSDISMEKKFSRRKKIQEKSFDINFEVENYLKYQGDNFVKRFDANSYIYITKAMDYFDVSENLLKRNINNVKFLVINFESDWLYPKYQSLDIIKLLRVKHVSCTYCEIHSTYGHDAFLIDVEEEARLIKPFLESIEI